MSTLRIVTGHDAAGLAELQTIGAPPGAEPFTHTPGFAVARVWHTRQTPVIEPAPRDEAATRASVLPEPGETMALMVTFPPDAALAAAAIDPQQAAAEFAARVPGLAEAFERDGSGYHTTDTILTYAALRDGMDRVAASLQRDGLGPGDVVVQAGTRHAWRNPGDRAARMFFVLIGARRRA